MLQSEHIPEGFNKDDIRVQNRRHLIFATDKQLEQLSKAKTWYIDGTFKLISTPFTQLLTINDFVRSEDCMKQVPFVYVVMSGKQKKDYVKVLKRVLRLLPSPKAVKATIDFEKAMWAAIRKVMPWVQISGCSFHWTQAVWRKVQELGLQIPYNEDDGTHRYIRKLLALPYLSSSEIPTQFRILEGEATTAPLKLLVKYISDTWITNSIWPPSVWSVYKQPVRTNNDVEGWHNSLNRRACGKVHLPFYLLINLLHQETQLTALYIRLVSDHKLKRMQRRKYRKLQARIFDHWEEYADGQKSGWQLLRACSRLVQTIST